MNKREHIKRHKELHKGLDELVADFITKTGKMPSKTPIFELMEWSHKQTINPDVKDALVSRFCSDCQTSEGEKHADDCELRGTGAAGDGKPNPQAH